MTLIQRFTFYRERNAAPLAYYFARKRYLAAAAVDFTVPEFLVLYGCEIKSYGVKTQNDLGSPKCEECDEREECDSVEVVRPSGAREEMSLCLRCQGDLKHCGVCMSRTFMLTEYEDRDDSVGYHATEKICPACVRETESSLERARR